MFVKDGSSGAKMVILRLVASGARVRNLKANLLASLLNRLHADHLAST
jgi:hypothetical protein